MIIDEKSVEALTIGAWYSSSSWSDGIICKLKSIHDNMNVVFSESYGNRAGLVEKDFPVRLMKKMLLDKVAQSYLDTRLPLGHADTFITKKDVLPERWCLCVTSEYKNYPLVCDWRRKMKMSPRWVDHGVITNTARHEPIPPKGSIEITMDDFIEKVFFPMVQNDQREKEATRCYVWQLKPGDVIQLDSEPEILMTVSNVNFVRREMYVILSLTKKFSKKLDAWDRVAIFNSSLERNISPLKHTFVLPKMWCVPVTSNSLDHPEVLDWRSTIMKTTNSYLWSNSGYISEMAIHTMSIPKDRVIITEEQFIKHVLKKELQEYEQETNIAAVIPARAFVSKVRRTAFEPIINITKTK
jgi:hypothetical protein